MRNFWRGLEFVDVIAVYVVLAGFIVAFCGLGISIIVSLESYRNYMSSCVADNHPVYQCELMWRGKR